MELNKNTIIERSDTILFSALDDQIVMMNIETGEYYDIDPIGSQIWEIIEGPQSISSICSQLIEKFDVTAEACEQEVIVFLAELLELGAVEAT